MGFGKFKKIKDLWKKAKNFLREKALPIMKSAVSKASPIVKNLLKEAPKYIQNDKALDVLRTGDKVLDIAKDGIDYIDGIGKRGKVPKTTDWTKANITPRLRV